MRMDVVPSPIWKAPKPSQRMPTPRVGSMGSAPLPCAACPEAKHVLDRLGGEGFSLGEGADPGVDGGKEGLPGLEPAVDEGPLGASRPALLAHRACRLGGGGQHLSQVPPEAALHDLLHHAPEVGGRLVVVLAGAGDAHAPHEVPFDQAWMFTDTLLLLCS